MVLAAGSRLGPYEVLSALGAGGMGEVDNARDTRLERTVAIKVLPTGGRRRSGVPRALGPRSEEHLGAEPSAYLHAVSGHRQISSGGGTRPMWSTSGRELFVVTGTPPRLISRIISEGGAEGPSIMVVSNWIEELKARMRSSR